MSDPANYRPISNLSTLSKIIEPLCLAQLHMAVKSGMDTQGIRRLGACTQVVRDCFLDNGMLLNPDKSEVLLVGTHAQTQKFTRSEERRVGKECRSRWSPYH